MSLSSAPASVNPSFVPAWSTTTTTTTTATPDWLFDDVAPDLGEAPLKALLYIVRRTSGFRKSADAISLSQFQHGITTRDGRQLDKGAGVKNRTTLLRALAELEARGIIGHQDTLHADGGHATTVYYLLGPGQGQGQGGGAASAPPPLPRARGGVVRSTHHPLVRQTHPQQTDVPTHREIERSVPPTPTDVEAGNTRFHEIAAAAAQSAGDPFAAAATVTPEPAPAVPPQRRVDADYQALAGPIAALVERLGDGAPPWASVSRGYGLMTRSGLDVPAFLALLAEAELLMRPSLPHIEKPMAYLFRVVESLLRQDAPPQRPRPPRATTRPRSSPTSQASPPPAPAPAPAQTADEWGRVRAELADQITPENYARWFAPTHQTDYDAGALTVAVPDDFHRQWLDRRLRGVVERCAGRVQSGLQVRFVVGPGAPPLDPAL
jgi:hypothetical protein